MYEEFYGLNEKPFSKTPDPRYLFLSRKHREALARLVYAVEERDLLLLTGEIGCGKTTLSRALMDEMGEKHRIILLTNPRLTPLEFLRTLAIRLEIEEPSRTKVELLEQIGKELYRFFQEDICPVLIIDEAQLVPYKETFDEIRLLTNFQLDDRNLLSVILVGQPELRKRLAHRAYEPLRQRIGMHYNLTPLDREETAEFIDFRIQVAGGKAGVFQEGAIEAIYRHSQGIPRKINHIASLALLEGFGRESRRIGADILDAIAPELEMAL